MAHHYFLSFDMGLRPKIQEKNGKVKIPTTKKPPNLSCDSL